MRKKGEKSIKTPIPIPDEHDDESASIPKGVFTEDFMRLCRKEGIYEIPVALRPQFLDEISQTNSGADEKESAPIASSSYNTFKLVPNTKYISPRLEVTYEDDQDLSTLKSLSFKGYLLTPQLLSHLSTCLPFCQLIQSLSLWNVGLTESTLSELAKLTASIPPLKQLLLNGNPVTGGDFSCLLLQERSGVETISLRGCALTLEQCSAIGTALRTNKTLTSLNLSNNSLDDSKAIAVVSGLRINRTLHCLSLVGNSVTDSTLHFMSKCLLSEFALTHEEIVERRKLVFASLDSIQNRELIDSPTKLGVSQGATPSPIQDKPSSVKLGRPSAHKAAASSKNIQRDEKSAKNIDKGRMKPVDSAKKRGGGSKMAKRAPEAAEADKSGAVEYANPLTEKVSMREKQIFIPGNMTLLSINLSYNLISLEGVSSLITAVNWQLSVEPRNPFKPGLLRVCLRNNRLSESDPLHTELQSLLSKQNPLSSVQEATDAQKDQDTDSK